MPHVMLIKMASTDDPEVFLELFECASSTWGWTQEERVLRLLPLLLRKAQLASQQLLLQTQLEYSNIKRAVLQCVGWTPEEHHRCFWSLQLPKVSCPFIKAQQLKHSC